MNIPFRFCLINWWLLKKSTIIGLSQLREQFQSRCMSALSPGGGGPGRHNWITAGSPAGTLSCLPQLLISVDFATVTDGLWGKTHLPQGVYVCRPSRSGHAGWPEAPSSIAEVISGSRAWQPGQQKSCTLKFWLLPPPPNCILQLWMDSCLDYFQTELWVFPVLTLSVILSLVVSPLPNPHSISYSWRSRSDDVSSATPAPWHLACAHCPPRTAAQ